MSQPESSDQSGRLPSWRFFSPSKQDKPRNPSQNQLFQTARSIDSLLNALIREAVQNALDQASDPGAPVEVRITTSHADGGLAPHEAAPYFQGIWPHLEAAGLPSAEQQPCSFLVFEDFGTTGLTGDPTEYPPLEPGVENNFLYFFRVEGQTSPHKMQADSLGRRGVGKIVFTMASAARTFFGYSVRAKDLDAGYSAGAGLLMGQATTKIHTLDSIKFFGDGWWGRLQDEDDPVEPLIDPTVIQEFKRTWSVSRETEPGLSIVVPYLEESWSVAQVVDALLGDYYTPIHAGRLTAKVGQMGGDSVEVTRANLREAALAAFRDDDRKREKVLGDLEMLEWADSREPVLVPVSWRDQRPAWENATITGTHELPGQSFEEECLKFRDTGRAFLRFPVRVVRKDGALAEDSHLDIIFSRDGSPGLPPSFVRRGVVVSQASNQPMRGVRAIARIEDPPLGRMLGDAEGGAHVEWSASMDSFKGAYEWGREWLATIRKSPNELLRLLEGDRDQPDDSIMADLFPDPDDQEGKNKKDGQVKGSQDESDQVATGSPDVKEITKRTPERLSAVPTPLGFRLRLGDQINAPKTAIVQLAYAVRNGDPFRKWTALDFDLGSEAFTIAAQGVKYRIAQNEFILEDFQPSDFKFEVSGFDANRDLELRIREA